LTHVGRHEQALNAAQKAVDLNPKGLYRGRLGDALARANRFDEAEECYKKMTSDCGCQACWVRYADFLLDHRKDKSDEARKSVEIAESKVRHRVSETSMKNIRIKLDLAPLRILAEKSPKEAEALGRRLLQESPTNGHYWFELAGILRTLGKHEEAVQAAQQAVRLSPDSSYQPASPTPWPRQVAWTNRSKPTRRCSATIRTGRNTGFGTPNFYVTTTHNGSKTHGKFSQKRKLPTRTGPSRRRNWKNCAQDSILGRRKSRTSPRFAATIHCGSPVFSQLPFKIV